MFSWTRIACTVLITAAVGVNAAPAQAATIGTVYVKGTKKVVYSASKGKVNRVVVTGSGRTVTIDDRVAIRAGAGCKAVKGDRTRVTCALKQDIKQVLVYLNDRDDTAINSSGLRTWLQGDNGDDTLTGGTRRDWLLGVAGNDTLSDVGGDNSIDGGAGRDVIHGGPDHDFIYGGTGADRLYGGAGDEFIMGGSGNDRIYGQEGGEALDGGEGDDKIYGGNGTDQLIGGKGADLLDGGANPGGGDECDGGSGRDSLTHCEIIQGQ